MRSIEEKKSAGTIVGVRVESIGIATKTKKQHLLNEETNKKWNASPTIQSSVP
jgi:hypothetical protein